jgi:hypothetical protein
MCIGLCIVIVDEEENQLDATQYFIALVIGLTCFRHHCAHLQELATIPLIATCTVFTPWLLVGGGHVQGGWLQEASAQTLSQPLCT